MRGVAVTRRDLVAVLGGAAAWPLAARAQHAAMPVVGLLNSASPETLQHLLLAFRQGLSETGHVEGQNLTMTFRWAQGDYDRLPLLAAELVRHPVDILCASGGGGLSAQAAKAATTTTPIVFMTADDPVHVGLVASFNRPGGNATGVTLFSTVLLAKQFELLGELVPHAGTLAALLNPSSATVEKQKADIQATARTLGRRIHVIEASSDNDFDRAFAEIVAAGAKALVVGPDPYFNSRRQRLVGLAARHAIPAVYEWREYVEAGGLMSYGTSLPEAWRQVARYAGRILKGEKPGDLPVVQPTKFELVINLKAANALGITIPPTLLARADEVIE